MAAAWPPTISAFAASTLLLRAAASTPRIIAAGADQRLALAVHHAARDVALRHVRQFVRQHRRQLVSAGGERDQPEVHAHVTARQRERIDAAVAHEKGFPGEPLVQVGIDVAVAARLRDERDPQRLEIFQQHRVVQVVGVAPDLAHDLFAQLALRAEAEIFRFGVAQGRQVVLRGGGRQAAAQRDGAQRGEPAKALVRARMAGRLAARGERHWLGSCDGHVGNRILRFDWARRAKSLPGGALAADARLAPQRGYHAPHSFPPCFQPCPPR